MHMNTINDVTDWIMQGNLPLIIVAVPVLIVLGLVFGLRGYVVIGFAALVLFNPDNWVGQSVSLVEANPGLWFALSLTLIVSTLGHMAYSHSRVSHPVTVRRPNYYNQPRG